MQARPNHHKKCYDLKADIENHLKYSERNIRNDLETQRDSRIQRYRENKSVIDQIQNDGVSSFLNLKAI